MIDTSSGISDYKLTQLSPPSGSEQSVTKTGLADDEYIAGWISPDTSLDKLIKGVYNWYIYAEKTGGTQTLRLYWQLVERKSDNTEIVIATSAVSNEISTSKGSYIIPLTLSEDYTLADGSYVVGKLYADVSDGGSAPDVAIYYDGSSKSHWEIPANTEIFKNMFIPYTGALHDVDLGSHSLTAFNLKSPASYIIWKDGSTYYATNGTTGLIEIQSTDASTVIQYAIDKLVALPDVYGRVHIMDGEYIINQPIIPDEGIWIQGNGIKNTILKLGDGVNDDVIKDTRSFSNNKMFFTISDLMIDGNRDNNTAGNGIHLYGSGSGQYWDVRMNRIEVIRCCENGIYLASGHGVGILHSPSEFNGDCGIRIDGGDYPFIAWNTIKGNDGHGIHIGCTSAIIIGNEIEGNSMNGLVIESSSHDGIISNNIHNNDGDAIYLKSAIRIRVIGNLIQSNTGYGMNMVSPTTDVVIVGNTFHNNTSGHFYNDGTGIIIKHNIGCENSGTAIFLGDGTTTSFNIAHDLSLKPTKVRVSPASPDAEGVYTSRYDADATNIVAKFKTAPPSPTVEDSNSGTVWGTIKTLTDEGKSWTDDEWIGHYVRITGGTGNGQVRRIIDNDATTLTIAPKWDGYDVIPDNSTTYDIIDSAIEIEWEAEV